jgi:hypothetical protein
MCTLMACTQVPSELEADILNVLQKAYKYKLKGKYLYIYAHHGKEIKLVQI